MAYRRKKNSNATNKSSKDSNESKKIQLLNEQMQNSRESITEHKDEVEKLLND